MNRTSFLFSLSRSTPFRGMTLPDYHVLYGDGSVPHNISDNRLYRKKDKGHKKAICSGQTRKAVTDSTGMLSYSLLYGRQRFYSLVT
jgi:hypothetical protein